MTVTNPKVVQAVSFLNSWLDSMPPGEQENGLHSIDVNTAHILKSNRKLRGEHPEEWEQVKHLCKECDTFGEMLKIARQDQTINQALTEAAL